MTHVLPECKRHRDQVRHLAAAAQMCNTYDSCCARTATPLCGCRIQAHTDCCCCWHYHKAGCNKGVPPVHTIMGPTVDCNKCQASDKSAQQQRGTQHMRTHASWQCNHTVEPMTLLLAMQGHTNQAPARTTSPMLHRWCCIAINPKCGDLIPGWEAAHHPWQGPMLPASAVPAAAAALL